MLKLYNTLTRKKEDFKPIDPPHVGIYSCGPTVYDYAHVGNLRAYLFVDILKRVLLYNKYDVKHVINITDVGHLTSDGDQGEDKIEKSAKLQSKSAWDIAEYYEKAFLSDVAKLNIIEPTIWAKATDHIKDQIKLIEKLEKKEMIYKISDGMYFDTSKFPDYGKLANLNLEGQEEGARVEVNQEKKNPTDFAVWKFSPEDETRQMEWKSPWGKGFPGWHIECSAMSMKYLGETFDIHTGGIDHVPVHHCNEIAQSESVTGKKFVNYWMHNNYLLVNEGKMSKSKGNLISMKTLEDKGIEPIVYRFYFLTAHYRSKQNFSFEIINNEKLGWDRFIQKFLDLGQNEGSVDEKYIETFEEFINDDLNMPRAFSVVHDVLKSDLDDFDKRATILKMDEVFGLGLKDMKVEGVGDIPDEIKSLADERLDARNSKRFDKSDEIRLTLKKMGWDVEDTQEGYKLKKI
ncbi:cysteine--tRNA ligase [Candidatus Falkowbacteria bacterium]|jgi:cysteinyl-tRNA synthetase|nr:cysteine--tRNA ligase [Candidatus Falkowbacteria bacterium]MBT7007043.1 cysteine--tRNA ligase [Candidatus Falkowbacteria bacterium]